MQLATSRMLAFLRSVLFVCLAFVVPQAVSADIHNDKVTLQLKWEHEFQFAGYYAALWQGYYADEGLDVEILPASRPDGSLLSPADELREGRADYAIGALDILVHRDRGEELVVLAPIFQRSPNSVFALPDTPLANIQDLAKLTIATPAEDFTKAEVLALYHAHGIKLDTARFIDKPPIVSTLLDGSADAIATYSISARTNAKESGVQLKELSPKDFGLDFYGDTLYTHQRVIERDPEQVEKFLRASLKGWDYALNHKTEIAQRIANELPRHLFSYDDLEGYNLAFADIIDNYMAYPYTQIGHNNHLRWQRMISRLREIGVISKPMDIDELVYSPERQVFDNNLQILLIVGFGLLLVLSLYYARRLRYVWLLYALLVGVIFYTEQTLETQLQSDHRKNLQVDVLQQLNSVADNLAGTVNRNLAHLGGMAAHLTANPDINQQQFARYAKAVFSHKPLLKNLGAAPDLVVSLIYPLEENRAALGLDYRKNPEQRDEVLKLKESGKVVVAGPLTLVQGGVAFIARTRVMAVDPQGQEYFWGILSAPFMAEELYKKAGLYDPDISVDIAIRGRNGRGASGDTFFGDSKLFSDQHALRTTIRIGSGTWQLAATPKDGWAYDGQGVTLIRASALGLALILLLFLLWQRRQMAAKELYEDKIRDNEVLLREMSRVALINGWKIPAGSHDLHWSSHTTDILGMDATEDCHSIESLLERFDQHQASKLRYVLIDALENGNPFDVEVSYESPDMAKRWLRWIGSASGSPVVGYEVTGALQDITERKKLSEVMEHQANYDLLTGLPNRSFFYESLKWAVSEAKRDNSKLAVLFIDLDKFKPVNDNYGHEAGDTLLREVAGRIHSTLRETDTVARISGDEFTVILRRISSELAPLDVAEKILTEIRKPYTVLDRQIYCGASIGISVYPEDSRVAEDLVSKADYAMYEVKKSGRNGCQYFTHRMQALSEQRHNLFNKLQQAVAGEQLTVVYQPVIDLQKGSVAKCEALVRWHDENGDLIPTQEFIALAEETSLVNDIDRFVLQHAGHTVAEMRRTLGVDIALSVNVSPRIFASTEAALASWIELAQQVAGEIDLTIEITERLLIQGPDRVMKVLQQLKAAGATIAIDDFGTGYSSLSYLTRLPIDYIKIDRAFVQALDESRESRMLVDTIISLAKNLDLKLIGEGVEQQHHLEILKDKGCDFVQGYLTGKPMPAEQLRNLIVSGVETT